MTSANSNLTKLNIPFVLKPVGKDYLWGGNRLKSLYNQNLKETPLAESWVCSTHEDGISTVGSGFFKGMKLKDVLKLHPEFMGRFANIEGEIPILVKFIDSADSLSIQVHPDDEYAGKYENASRGKKEMWYILEADEDAEIILGFRHDIEKEEIERRSKDGTILNCLNRIKVGKDRIYSVEPGTVHGIGGGIILAEIQENSNLTYRMYDYDRTDKNGRKRELNIGKALDVINTKSALEERQPMRVLNYMNGRANELLYRCKYFQTERMLINSYESGGNVIFKSLSEAFQVLLCIDGDLKIKGEEFEIAASKGTCIFVPAGDEEYELEGCAQFLKIRA